MLKPSANLKPRITCSLPDLNKNVQILLCSKCKSAISPSSAYVFRSNSAKTSCWCLPGDRIYTDSSEFISTLISSANASVTSDTFNHNVEKPECEEFLEASVSSIVESSIASWRALADHKYLVSDSETSSIFQDSSEDVLSSKLCLPQIKKIESVCFNIIHIDPEENYPFKFLMYNDQVKSNSNNNLMNQSQVYYMPLKLNGIREEVELIEQSTSSSRTTKNLLQHRVQCLASKGDCQTLSVAYDFALNSNSSISPMRTSANSITEIPTDVYGESWSISKVSVRDSSAIRAVHPHVASLSEVSAKQAVHPHVASMSEVSAKQAVHPHVASLSEVSAKQAVHPNVASLSEVYAKQAVHPHVASLSEVYAKQAVHPHVASLSEVSAKQAVHPHVKSLSEVSAKQAVHPHVASQSKVSAKRAVHAHVASQSEVSAKRAVHTHVASQSEVSAKRAVHTHVASQSPILKISDKKASLETKLKKLQEISYKFKY